LFFRPLRIRPSIASAAFGASLRLTAVDVAAGMLIVS
jgi:hypothetical protein